MSLELLAAEKLLEMALSAIVGDAASEGAKLLWQKIKDRLLQNHQPVIEAEIVELEQNQNLTQENLKPLKPFLEVEMLKDRLFAEEISKLGREIANAISSDTIEMKGFVAKDNAAVVGKAEGTQQFFGGTHNHEKK
ncbi:conserved hypothetical protein [Hyella patelloides LEGE 07179]|uniref:Uncharacterized protein n=1 Tax=Hyella patelloides LEGE 07179 TaxID=945734 RepID=A0A563VY39_9CYAN|nr:hypothetical protein [Hyella patelloides]VEP16336.1 conserved hypothetical protein [Hyella patelloides LEGE 07179]